MPTVQETLRQTGFTDEQIAAMDPRAITAFSSVLTTAEQKEKEAREAAQKAEEARVAAQQAREAAELEKRSNVEFYETKVMPGLLGFEEEKKALETARINAESKATFYETQIKGLKDAGFLPSDAPSYVVPTPTGTPQRDNQGRYVAGPSGSPTYIDPNQVAGRIGDVAGTLTDIQWKHQMLYGKPLPIPPSQLIAQADAVKLSPAEYAARTFKFQEREQQIAEEQRQQREKQVADAAVAAKQKEWDEEKAKILADAEAARKKTAESMGNNPDVRVAVSSKMPELARATKAGERKDPLKMTDNERRQYTRTQIHKEVEENAQAVA